MKWNNFHGVKENQKNNTYIVIIKILERKKFKRYDCLHNRETDQKENKWAENNLRNLRF